MVTIDTNLWPRRFKNFVVSYAVAFDTTVVVNMFASGYLPRWSATFSVPHGTAIGLHNVRVQQSEFDTLNSTVWITACKNVPFEVRSSTGNPWIGSRDTTDTSFRADTTNRVGITVHFDPSLVCDVKACDAIRLIQVMQEIGVQGDTAILLPATGRYFDGISKDSTRTASGFLVDAWDFTDHSPAGLKFNGKPYKAERDPYVNGQDPVFDRRRRTVGYVRGDSTNASRYSDKPGAVDGNYPVGVTKIIRRFEVCAICSAGEQRGRYFGQLLWRWSREKGGAAVVDSVQTSRDQPSGMFIDALTLWASKRRFTTPRVQAPIVGGTTCP